MEWLEIGTYNSEKAHIKIHLHSGFEKALKHLGLFSHCVLYFLATDHISVLVGKLVQVDDEKGLLLISTLQSDQTVKGQLVDIKPYFPVEEVIKEDLQNVTPWMLPFNGEALGRFTLIGQREVIQLNSNQTTIKRLEGLKTGDYIRVLWWFHRFDKEQFRRNRTCNPPYKDAPNTGIFASRSPVRPNPIGSTIVKILSVDSHNRIIEVEGFDGFRDTPILQMMSYNIGDERITNALVPRWVDHWASYKVFNDQQSIVKEIPQKPHSFIVDETFQEKAIQSSERLNNEGNSDYIHVQNARINNLKNLCVKIPKNQITLITGVSGSGKSSLAFDTLYVQSQRQYMDLVMSNQMMPDMLSDQHVDKITGLQPAIAIKQSSLGNNPRSTVGSVTKIVELLRLLYATIATRLCSNCHHEVGESQVCDQCGTILFNHTPQVYSHNHPDYMCPVCKGLGIEMRIDPDKIVEYPEKSLLDCASSFYGDLRKHQKKPNANWMRGEVLALAIDLSVDLNLPYNQLPENFKQQFLYGSEGRIVKLEYKNSKGRSGIIERPVEGAIPLLERLIHDSKASDVLDRASTYMTNSTCSRCQGERLKEEGRFAHIYGYRFPQIVQYTVKELRYWCHNLYAYLKDEEKIAVRPILTNLNQRLERVESVGLSYIDIDRSIPSLSGGESQRLKLATQFGSGLSNMLYIMDEPSKGLHPKDYQFIMEAIVDLKEQKNTIVLVEHKKSFLKIADYHIEIGPKAGHYGGEIVKTQDRDDLDRNQSFLTKNEDLDHLTLKKMDTRDGFGLQGVYTHNLKGIDVIMPYKKIISIIGVSGSGKSSLISDTLYPKVRLQLGKTVKSQGQLSDAFGLECFQEVLLVDQKPIGNNSRSNPATYTGVFDLIRDFYADLPESKKLGMSKAHFSFNSKKGQCPVCKGLGEVSINMHYMDDMYVPCSRCHKKRYLDQVLTITYKGYSIGDLLELEIEQVAIILRDEEKIYEKLDMLCRVGLGYLKLGQSASTLSGGEAQRIKIAKELSKNKCQDCLYLLDEPTSGLHEDDVKLLIEVLQSLKNKGATIILIEHNPQIIRASDYLIELGPVGGIDGGRLIRSGYVDVSR